MRNVSNAVKSLPDSLAEGMTKVSDNMGRMSERLGQDIKQSILKVTPSHLMKENKTVSYFCNFLFVSVGQLALNLGCGYNKWTRALVLTNPCSLSTTVNKPQLSSFLHCSDKLVHPLSDCLESASFFSPGASSPPQVWHRPWTLSSLCSAWWQRESVGMLGAGCFFYFLVILVKRSFIYLIVCSGGW